MRAFHIFRGFQLSFPAAESLSCQSHVAGLGASSWTQHVSAKATGTREELTVNIRSPCMPHPLPCAITDNPGRSLAKADSALRCGWGRGTSNGSGAAPSDRCRRTWPWCCHQAHRGDPRHIRISITRKDDFCFTCRPEPPGAQENGG